MPTRIDGRFAALYPFSNPIYAFETLDRMPQDLTRYTDELEAMCLNSTIGIHEPDMSEVIYRKMRKLYRNPRLFFADSYRKWFR